MPRIKPLLKAGKRLRVKDIKFSDFFKVPKSQLGSDKKPLQLDTHLKQTTGYIMRGVRNQILPYVHTPLKLKLQETVMPYKELDRLIKYFFGKGKVKGLWMENCFIYGCPKKMNLLNKPKGNVFIGNIFDPIK